MSNLLRVVLTLLVSVGACVGVSDAQSVTPGVTKDSITIGMYGPLTGSQSLGSLPMYGAAAIYQSINDAGGIHGRHLKLIIRDGACDPNRTIATVKKFINVDKVFMVNGGWCSAAALAIKPIFAEHPNTPFVDVAAASAAVSTPVMKNVFQPVATATTVANTLFKFAEGMPGEKRIGIIAHSNEWAKSHLVTFEADMKKAGIKPVAQVVLQRGATDATPQVLQLRKAKPSVIFAILYPPETALFLRQANEYGLKAPILGTQVISITGMNDKIKNPAIMSKFYTYSSVDHGYKTAEAKKWVDIFKKYYPHLPVNDLSVTGMAGALAVVDALKSAGRDLTQQKFIDALDKVHNFNPGVSSGAISFSPTDHAGINVGKVAYIRYGAEHVVSNFSEVK